MKNKFLISLFVVFACSYGHAKIERPILFSATKDGQTSYIMGTIHLGIDFNEIPASVIKKIESRAIFMSESGNLNAKDEDNDNLNDNSEEISEATTPLTSPFKPETIAKFNERGFTPTLLKVVDMTPGVACYVYLWLEWFLENPGTPLSFDSQIYEFAKGLGKILIDLDDASVDDTAEVLSKCDANELVDDLSPIDAAKAFALDMENYRKGNIQPYESMEPEQEDIYQVTQRNLKWIDKIVQAHSQGAFVTMGENHLSGTYGILKLMEERGFKIERSEE